MKKHILKNLEIGTDNIIQIKPQLLEKSIVTIGLPVFNGEKFLKERIDSILNQTLINFELIISDNASTDNTSSICKKYSMEYSNIRYFRQGENIGIILNFKFLLDNATSDYFVWAAADDLWLPEFLEKNIEVLKNEKKFVGSISRIEYFGKNTDFYSHQNKPSSDKFLEKKKIRSYEDYPKRSTYEERIKFYLIFPYAENFYGVFRTKEIKKSFIHKAMIGLDKAIILKILKYGEINILDNVLMKRSSEGFSESTSLIDKLNQFNDYGLMGKIFPFLPFTLFCMKELGMRIFLNNFEYFIRINYGREKFLLKYLFQTLRKKLKIRNEIKE